MLSQNKLLIIGGGAIFVVIAILLVLVLSRGFGEPPPQRVTLQFWGVFDDARLYNDTIRAYEDKFPNVNIIYKKISSETYENQLLDSFSSGTGPDIWLIHNDWLPRHIDRIQPLPQEVQKATKKPLMTLKDFKDQFVDVTVSDLTNQGKIYGLPLYVDTLALYWNKDLFNSKGITLPPATWESFNEDIISMTQFSNSGSLQKSGAAIGTAKNINRSTDILGLMFLQAGTQMTDASHTSATFNKPVNNLAVGESALQYYTGFADSRSELYTWNDSQHYSIDAFQEGSTAMMFNYSHQIDVLKSRAPRLNFAVAPMPQFSSIGTIVNYASYWVPTVAKSSANPLEAWKFLAYLSSSDGVKSYLNNSKRPAARRDLIDIQKSDPQVGVFATQALSARSWYQGDNRDVESIFAQMIDDVNLKGISVRDALFSAENKVSAVLSRLRR